MTNADVARAFSNLATMLEMDGANPFRIRAYREAARVVTEQAEPIAKLAALEGRLEQIAGIGKDLAGKIRDLVATGSTALYSEMQAKYPLEVVGLTELQGVGPKRVKMLFQTLGIKNRDDLKLAALAGKLRELPGFGETMEKKVLKALETAGRMSGRMLLSGAWPVAHAIAEHVRRLRGVERVELAGSFRRRKETVGDLDVLVSGGTPDVVMEAFVTHPDVAEVLGRGDTKSSVRMKNGLQVDLRLVPVESFGAALLYFTGSKEHNIELRKLAIDKGLSLNEYGLTRGERQVAGRTEEEVYKALGMSFVPPELRESRGEIALALENALPTLIGADDIRADLHIHTDRTDGRDSLETMVRAARERGYEYCAITDHSKALAMAFGFDAARVRKSVAEIAAVRKQVPGIEILHGLEVDILADGELDLDDETLALLDWVIVSLHSRLDQPRDQATARVLAAIANPHVHVMGHPTARMIGAREPVAFDLEKVLERAAECGVAMEINAQPHRTDLSDVNARLARERDVDLVISTDAHSTLDLDFMRYGLFTARRAGLTRANVLNALPLARFRERTRRRGGATSKRAPSAASAATPIGAKPGVAERASRTASTTRAVKSTGAKQSATKAVKPAPSNPRAAGKQPSKPIRTKKRAR